jgi:hypothetical protein
VSSCNVNSCSSCGALCALVASSSSRNSSSQWQQQQRSHMAQEEILEQAGRVLTGLGSIHSC